MLPKKIKRRILSLLKRGFKWAVARPLLTRPVLQMHRIWHFLFRPNAAARNHYIDRYDEVSLDPDLVLLESFWGRRIGCNPYAIYKTMKALTGDRFRYVWVRNKGVSAPPDVESDPSVSFVVRYSRAHMVALLRAGYLVNNMTFPPFFVKKPGQFYLNPWHGVPIKTLGVDADSRFRSVANTHRNLLQADSIPLAGDYCAQHFLPRYLADGLAMQRYIATGSPRLDVSLLADREAIRSRLGIRDGDTVVLYAPTWRGAVDRIETEIGLQLDAIRTLQQSLPQGSHLFLSLHNFVCNRLGSVETSCQRVPDDMDMNEFLAGVDVLVSDYSSIVIDFLVFDRPIILHVPDRDRYEAERGLYLSLESLPATLTTSLDGLATALRNPAQPSGLPGHRETLRRLLPHEDGQASSRVVHDMIGRGMARAAESPRRRRILIYPGGLLRNGISSSFLNLMHSIDHSVFEVFVLADAGSLDRNKDAQRYLAALPPQCNLVLRTGRFQARVDEKVAYYRLLRGEELEAGERRLVERAFAREYRRLLGDHGFDLAIDFSGYSPYWTLLLGCSAAGRKVIYQHNDLWAEANNPLKSHRQMFGVFASYRLYDAAVSVSPLVAELNLRSLSKYYPNSPGFQLASRNAIDAEGIRQRAAHELEEVSPEALAALRRGDIVKFVAVGRLSPEKNHTLLLQAFKKYLDSGGRGELFLAGDGPLRGSLVNTCEALGIQSVVHFLGNLSNPYPLMSAADCLVLSSDYEGQPMVLLEALVLGLPIIATDIPMVRYMLKEYDAVLVEQDPAALAQTMLAVRRKAGNTHSFDAEDYNRQVMAEFYAGPCGLPEERLQERLGQVERAEALTA